MSYRGLTKIVRFQPDGNMAGPSVYMYQVVHGRAVQLGLIPWA
ncbi:MAG TPA: hypothetical protein VEJ84_22820 [Acidimicrobiales bacterium]|nr:hypothetical protein [Acidimicrobiales bacterium]